jgi:hypothetical protein
MGDAGEYGLIRLVRLSRFDWLNLVAAHRAPTGSNPPNLINLSNPINPCEDRSATYRRLAFAPPLATSEKVTDVVAGFGVTPPLSAVNVPPGS